MKNSKILLTFALMFLCASSEVHAFSISVVGAFDDSSPGKSGVSGLVASLPVKNFVSG